MMIRRSNLFPKIYKKKFSDRMDLIASKLHEVSQINKDEIYNSIHDIYAQLKYGANPESPGTIRVEFNDGSPLKTRLLKYSKNYLQTNNQRLFR